MCLQKALAEAFKQKFQIVDHIDYFWIALSSYVTWPCTDIKMTSLCA